MRFLPSRRDGNVSVQAQSGKHIYNSQNLGESFVRGSGAKNCCTRHSPGVCARAVASSSSQYHLLVSTSAMPSIDRADDHLGELRDALALMSFTLMAALTEVAAEHDCRSPNCGCWASCAIASRQWPIWRPSPAWSARRSAA